MIHLELTDEEARALLVNGEFVEMISKSWPVEADMFLRHGSPLQLALRKLTSALERAGVDWESIRP